MLYLNFPCDCQIGNGTTLRKLPRICTGGKSCTTEGRDGSTAGTGTLESMVPRLAINLGRVLDTCGFCATWDRA